MGKNSRKKKVKRELRKALKSSYINKNQPEEAKSRFLQSVSGKVIEITPEGETVHLDLGQITEKGCAGVVVNRKTFEIAYAKELYLIRAMHKKKKEAAIKKQEEDRKKEEKKKKKEEKVEEIK